MVNCYTKNKRLAIACVLVISMMLFISSAYVLADSSTVNNSVWRLSGSSIAYIDGNNANVYVDSNSFYNDGSLYECSYLAAYGDVYIDNTFVKRCDPSDFNTFSVWDEDTIYTTGMRLDVNTYHYGNSNDGYLYTYTSEYDIR